MTDRSAPEPVSRRPPPLPPPRLMTQQWRDVAFLHWPVPADRVAPLLPPGIVPDVHDGTSWVGLVPFRMVDAGVAGGPAVPWAGSFLETNVRLYSVDRTGRRGVVFRSLDAQRLVVVLGAQAVFGLPYRWARMDHRVRRGPGGPDVHDPDGHDPDGQHGTVHEYVLRRHSAGSVARSRVVLRVGETIRPSPLEDFLTARWGLHVRHLGRTWFLPNAHPPWPLRAAELLAHDGDLLDAAGLDGLAGRPPPSVLFSDGVSVAFGRPTPV